ncbi:hypothetical protein AGDE_12894 [Angomonas deanei]|uniref:Uncharacterized protein n=1 Tax=Angomonas deanei TaxID=59799 RepID=A0A7G2C140_9TRYP|nr:hypothetical protein AGDE_12894 [Angomonas deanei]CAD2213399.1 hypothetical protein, conserved [Angomonas deanei]|eukprot:EPY23324.1 hypothetical protein AGDE_12894 [Angomonas deanei]
MRVCMRSCKRQRWIQRVVNLYLQNNSAQGVVAAVSSNKLFQLAACYGIKGNAASALVSLGINFCFCSTAFVTSNTVQWNKAKRMSAAQYRYNLATHVYTAAAVVGGAAVGAVVGSVVLPVMGIGAAVGGTIGSFAGNYVPTRLRRNKGPDDLARAYTKKVSEFPTARVVKEEDGFTELQVGSESDKDGDTVLRFERRRDDAPNPDEEDVPSRLSYGQDVTLSTADETEDLEGELECLEMTGKELNAYMETCESDEMMLIYLVK